MAVEVFVKATVGVAAAARRPTSGCRDARWGRRGRSVVASEFWVGPLRSVVDYVNDVNNNNDCGPDVDGNVSTDNVADECTHVNHADNVNNVITNSADPAHHPTRYADTTNHGAGRSTDHRADTTGNDTNNEPTGQLHLQREFHRYLSRC